MGGGMEGWRGLSWFGLVGCEGRGFSLGWGGWIYGLEIYPSRFSTSFTKVHGFNYPSVHLPSAVHT